MIYISSNKESGSIRRTGRRLSELSGDGDEQDDEAQVESHE